MATRRRKRKPQLTAAEKSVQALNAVFRKPKHVILMDSFIVISGIAILQFHGIFFWMEFVGLITGAWLSILLECIAFWCWFRKPESSWRYIALRVIAPITTALLLIGPIHTVGKSILNEVLPVLRARIEFELEAARLDSAIEEKSAQEERLLSIIEKTADGWNTYNALRKDKTGLQEKRAALQAPKSLNIPAVQFFIISVQGIAIFVIQAVVIIAILDLAPKRRKRPKDARGSPLWRLFFRPSRGTIVPISRYGDVKKLYKMERIDESEADEKAT